MKTQNGIDIIISGCRKGDRQSQDALYKHYFGYVMGIALRYAGQRDVALEITNDVFLKALTKLEKYSGELSFKSWLAKIAVNTSIDSFRKNKYTRLNVDLSYAKSLQTELVVSNLNQKDLLQMVQDLAPSYRVVFNLYVIDGYKHWEIAKKLGISEGTSKSNLSIARAKLKKSIQKESARVSNHGR